MQSDRHGRKSLTTAAALLLLVGLAVTMPALILSPRSPGTPGFVNAAARDVVAISAPVPLSLEPLVILESGSLSVRGESSSLLARLTGGEAEFVLSNAVIRVESEASGSGSNATAEAALSPLLTALQKREFRHLSLADVSIDVRTGSGSGITRTVSGVHAEVVQGSSGASVRGTLQYRGETVGFDFGLGRWTAAGELPVRASIRGRHVTSAFEGRVTAGEELEIEAQNAELKISNLREAVRWLGTELTTGPGLGAFSAKGRLNLTRTGAAFEGAHFMLDGNAASGAMTLSLAEARPALQGTLAFETLDLAPYSPRRESALKVAANWLSGLHIPGFAGSSILNEIDTDLRVSAKSVLIGSSRLGGCAASIVVKNGKLDSEVAELQLEHGGVGTGQLGIEMLGTMPRVTLRAELDGVDFGGLGAQLGRTLLEGQGKLSLDITGAGLTHADVMSSLSGKVSVDLLQGQLDLAVGALKPASEASPTAATAAMLASSSTPVQRLVARFTGANGIFTAETLTADTGAESLAAVGLVDLADREIDLTLSIAPTDSQASPSGRATRAYRIRGPWLSPSVTSMTRPGKSAEPATPLLDGTPRAPG